MTRPLTSQLRRSPIFVPPGSILLDAAGGGPAALRPYHEQGAADRGGEDVVGEVADRVGVADLEVAADLPAAVAGLAALAVATLGGAVVALRARRVLRAGPADAMRA